MVEHGDLTGVTSNATIFEKAIDAGHDYDQSLSRLIAAKPQLTAHELYERMSILHRQDPWRKKLDPAKQ